MRPVRRGRPHREIKYNTQTKLLLIERLGDFCSYCERPTSHAIEHVLPWKRKHTRLQHSWNNFLLTCVNCNAYMRDRQISDPLSSPRLARRRYVWPDTDNTQRAFRYLRTGHVVVAPTLRGAQATLAKDTRHMLGFDEPADDLRVKYRRDKWRIAERQRAHWRQSPTDDVLQDILDMASAGAWSVWYSVFEDQPEVTRALILAAKGTERRCFSKVGQIPVPRPKGQL